MEFFDPWLFAIVCTTLISLLVHYATKLPLADPSQSGGYLLVLGRDMNEDGTDIGPQTEALLRAARAFQQETGCTLVVAPGYNPDLPHQLETLAHMMARHLYQFGADKLVVLEARTFNTIGELLAYQQFLMESGGRAGPRRVLGYSWHLPRVRLAAWRHLRKGMSRSLTYVPVPQPMSTFDRCIEVLKWPAVLLSLRRQQQMVRFYKRYISTRTSY